MMDINEERNFKSPTRKGLTLWERSKYALLQIQGEKREGKVEIKTKMERKIIERMSWDGDRKK